MRLLAVCPNGMSRLEKVCKRGKKGSVTDIVHGGLNSGIDTSISARG